MSITPNQAELQALEHIWESQAKCTGEPLDLTHKYLPETWALGPDQAPEPEEAAGLLQNALGWPQWVRLYDRAPFAVRAAAQLAKQSGLAPGVIWVAPGTGSPLPPPGGNPGVAILRADWAPDAQSLHTAADHAVDSGLMLVMDECATALRLPGGGARAHYGLKAGLAIFGPSMAAGRDLAALAGVGPEPPLDQKQPGPEALAALAGILARAGELDIPARLEAWGRALALGLAYYKDKVGLGDEIGLEGPAQMPRLTGERLWAFVQIAQEEGLLLTPLVLFDPSQDPATAPETLWPRLARSAARLKVLPQGDKAPESWPVAYATACGKGSQDA